MGTEGGNINKPAFLILFYQFTVLNDNPMGKNRMIQEKDSKNFFLLSPWPRKVLFTGH